MMGGAKKKKRLAKEQVIRVEMSRRSTILERVEKVQLERFGRAISNAVLLSNDLIPEGRIPIVIPEPYNNEINELIKYIVDGKMSINAALKKANISSCTGIKYYHHYLNDQKRNRPT
jgi:hypothetical protein